jgi:YD repeat-containing protein
LASWDGTPSAAEFTTLAAALRALVPPVDEPSPTSAPTDGYGRSHRPPRPLTPALLTLVALVTASAAAGVWYWDAYYRVHVEHFANVRARHGLPEGVGRLDAAQVSRRTTSLSLIRHGRRNPVDEVRLVNSDGHTPAPSTYIPTSSLIDLNPLASLDIDNPFASDMMTVTRVSFARDAEGGVLEQTGFGRGGRPVYTLRYASRETAEYKVQGFTRSIRASGIAYLRFRRVDAGPNAGLDERVVFLDAAQQPQPSESGAYGYRVTFDDRGLPREAFPLGPGGEDRPNNYGVFKTVMSRSPLGDIAEMTSVDQKGARVTDRVGIAESRWQYDASGNLTRLAFYDRNGELVATSTLGAARLDMAYDNRGRATSVIFVGADQQPVLGPQRFARKTLQWLTPSTVSSRFYDPKDHRTPVLGLAFEIVDTFDERGLPIEESFRDINGEPTRIENGCSTLQLAHDALGNDVEYRCLNEQRGFTFSTDGWSILRSTYDERGNLVTTDFFDPQDKPGNLRDFHTRLRREYNAFGKISKEIFGDASGAARGTRSGEAAITYTYDRNGNRIEEAYLDEKGRPVAIVGGYAFRRSEFDGKNREVRTSFRSVNGNAVRTNEGYAAIGYEYDDRGFVSASTFFDEAGHPIKTADGYASVRRKRDSDGRVLEISYFDERGTPVVTGRPGSARRRWTYDALGRVVERADYDTTGRPMSNAYGYSTVRFSYDEYGNETGRRLFDTSGGAVTLKVAVDKVTSGSVAADAGFQVGDVIVAYDGQRVDTTYQFANRLELFKGDRRREIRVERGGQTIGLDLRPGRIFGFEIQEKAYP